MSIKLEDFVAESLIQIVRGVEKAQNELGDSMARINPRLSRLRTEGTVGSAKDAQAQPVYPVQFDVAVMASEETSTAGGIGVVVGVFGLGSRGQSAEGGGQTSRIQFKVPVLLPLQEPK